MKKIGRRGKKKKTRWIWGRYKINNEGKEWRERKEENWENEDKEREKSREGVEMIGGMGEKKRKE